MLNRSCFILALLTVFVVSGCSKKTEIKKNETSNSTATTQASNEPTTSEAPAASLPAVPSDDTGATTPADENDNALIGELEAAQVQTQVIDNALAFRLATEEGLFAINGVVNKLENFDEALIESGVAICILRTDAMSANDLNGLSFIGKDKKDEITEDGYRLYVVAGQSTSGVALTTACIRANNTPFLVKEVRAAFKGIMTVTIK